ncbi:hypothetical protein B0A49_12748, partial [Cryomyces minteri]
MAPKPQPKNGPKAGESSTGAAAPPANSSQANMPPPQATPSNAGAEGSSSLAPAEGVGRKKKKHRAGAKRRNRRKSFAAPSEGTEDPDMTEERPSLLDVPSASAARASFYRLGNAGRSNTSLESEALLDHR